MTLFYERAKDFQPVFWWGDFERNTMTEGTMREGAEAFRSQLKELGAQKVGAYIANHLYQSFDLDVDKFDAIWMPTNNAMPPSSAISFMYS